MSTVAKLLRKQPLVYREKISHDWPLPKTLMGIELEAEGNNGAQFSRQPPHNWTAHRDGSLLNGIEFVLAQPLAADDLRTAISAIFQNNTFTRSMTGSTHIHVNMTEDSDTEEVLRVLVVLVYCLESMLYAAGDPSREWCGFANRLMSGPDTLLSVVLADTLDYNTFNRNYSRAHSQAGRYYGLNMAALVDYGSLEFRYFPTATSEQELIQWVELVQTFKKVATEVGSVAKLSNIMMVESEFSAFLERSFGKFAHLFPHLGSYHEVRTAFQKALITAKLPPVQDARRDFDARKIFSNGKYSKFVKKVPSSTVTVFLYGRNGTAIPDYPNTAQEGDVLVYNRMAYVMRAMSPARSMPSWQLVTDLHYSTVRDPVSLKESLLALVSDSEAYAMTHDYVRENVGVGLERLEGLILGGQSADNASETADLPDEFDDDYEDEMEDE